MFCKKASFFSYLFIFLSFASPLLCIEKSPREELSNLIKEKDLAQVQQFMEKGLVELESPSKYKEDSPLIEAASHGKISIMKYFLEHGAFVEGISGSGKTTLTELIKSCYMRINPKQLLEAVRILLSYGADVNGLGKDKYTPLMEASIYSRSKELIDYLIEHGANVNYLAEDGMTALILSFRNNNQIVLDALLEQGADIYTYKNTTPLGSLAMDGNVYMAKALMKKIPADVNEKDAVGRTPLMIAAGSGNIHMVRFLIDQKADINTQTTNPMYIEIKEKSPFLSFYKKYKIIPEGSTALTFARHFGGIPTANMLIDLGGVEYKPVAELEEVTRNLW